MTQPTPELQSPLTPCPFCGHPVDDDLSDTLYPSGISFRPPDGGYVSHSERQEGDVPCWAMHCVEHHGGCGATVHGDTEAETRARWNRRALLSDSDNAEPKPLRNSPLSALAIRFLVAAGHVTQAKANEAFTLACTALEYEARKMDQDLPWVAVLPPPEGPAVAALRELDAAVHEQPPSDMSADQANAWCEANFARLEAAWKAARKASSETTGSTT